MADIGSGDCEDVQMSRNNPNHPNYSLLAQTDLEEDSGAVDGRLTSVISAHDLGKLLECPVCYEVPLPPVFMCASGHNICLDCRNQCLSCPVCRCSFTEARNHLAESIVDKCSFICRYHTLGCTSVLCGNQMVKHLQMECEFRPVTCRDCRRKIPFESYLGHLTDFENIPKQLATECSTGFDIEEDDFSHDWTGQTWEPTWLHCFGYDFFCYLESSSLYWWIYVIGYASDAVLDGFMYDVLVWNQSKSMESRFIGPVHSYRKTGSDILHTGKCLKTTEQGIRAMMNQGGIDVVVRIFKTSDYQPPKSRNTGQPIYSPLSLRANNNSNTNNNNNNNNNGGVISPLTPNLTSADPESTETSASITTLPPSHSSHGHGHGHAHQQRTLHTLSTPISVIQSPPHSEDGNSNNNSNSINGGNQSSRATALALALEEMSVSANVGSSGTNLSGNNEERNTSSAVSVITSVVNNTTSVNFTSSFSNTENSSSSPSSSIANTGNSSVAAPTSNSNNNSNDASQVLQPPQGRRRVRTPCTVHLRET